jgi:hypothetical protein
MDELTKYIFDNYAYLMTIPEKKVYKSILGEAKAENSDSPEMQSFLRRRMVSSEPQVLALLENGEDAFMESVRDRILRESADEVYLNHCPKCGALARRPQSKQCQKCFYSWHGAA